MLSPRRPRATPVDRLQVSRHVKLGTLPRLARETGLTETELVTEARRQYADLSTDPGRHYDELVAPHLKAAREGLIAELDAWLAAR